MKVEIKEAKYPRKGSEYATVIVDDSGRQMICVQPYIGYEAQARLVKQAFEALLATPDGEAKILAAIELLP